MADAELAELKRKVLETEGEVAGEKIVTRHILEQLRANTEILLEMRKEMLDMRKELGKVSERVAINSA